MCKISVNKYHMFNKLKDLYGYVNNTLSDKLSGLYQEARDNYSKSLDYYKKFGGIMKTSEEFYVEANQFKQLKGLILLTMKKIKENYKSYIPYEVYLQIKKAISVLDNYTGYISLDSSSKDWFSVDILMDEVDKTTSESINKDESLAYVTNFNKDETKYLYIYIG